jgi:hypothetical protein
MPSLLPLAISLVALRTSPRSTSSRPTGSYVVTLPMKIKDGCGGVLMRSGDVSARHAARHGDNDLRGSTVSAVIITLNSNRIDSPFASTQTVSSQFQGQWPSDFPI